MAATDYDDVLGSIDLSHSTQLIFSIRPWKGRTYASIRKVVDTARYRGFTKSGMLLLPDLLVEVIGVLHRLQSSTPKAQQQEFERITKYDSADIVITLVIPDDLKSLPSVDVREYVNKPGYTGPTKKGVRFPFDKLGEVIALLQLQADHLGTKTQDQPTLFEGAEPKWVKKAEAVKETDPLAADDIHNGLLGGNVKDFPDAFLEGVLLKKEAITLPDDTLDSAALAGGRHVVHSKFGFEYEIRNDIEGKYLIYAHLRGHRNVRLPQDMIGIFKAVKAYENYVRQLRGSFLQEYERKSGHKPIAEHKTKQVFKTYGLPWLDYS